MAAVTVASSVIVNRVNCHKTAGKCANFNSYTKTADFKSLTAVLVTGNFSLATPTRSKAGLFNTFTPPLFKH